MGTTSERLAQRSLDLRHRSEVALSTSTRIRRDSADLREDARRLLNELEHVRSALASPYPLHAGPFGA